MALYIVNVSGPTAPFTQIATGLGSNVVDESGEGYFSPWGPKEGTTEADYPVEADVEVGVEYGNGSYTGTFEAPVEADVRSGVGYGAGGTEYTGTLSSGASVHTWVQ